MQATARAEARPVARSTTPQTDSATFIITDLDVGSVALRPGVAERLEQERYALLLAAQAVLAKIKAGKLVIGAAHEAMLDAAVRMAEAGK